MNIENEIENIQKFRKNKEEELKTSSELDGSSDSDIDETYDDEEVQIPKELPKRSTFLKIHFVSINHYLRVINPVQEDGHIRYCIETSLYKLGNTKLTRRYNDFKNLRSRLVDRWPGIYIPNIPPKRLLFLEQAKELSDSRCRGLNKFMNKIKQNQPLLNSKELKIFLTESLSSKIETQLKNLKIPTLIELMMIYKDCYLKDLSNIQFTETEIVAKQKELNNYEILFSKVFVLNQSMKDLITDAITSKMKEVDLQKKLFSNLLLFEQGDASKSLSENIITRKVNEIGAYFKQYKAPYQELYEFFEDLELEIEAHTQAIQSYRGLVSRSVIIKKIKKDKELELKELIEGKITSKSFFSLKSREEIIKSSEGELNKIDLILKSYSVLSDIIIKKNLQNLENFIKEIKEQYRRAIETTMNSIHGNNFLFTEWWESIKKTLDNN